MGRRKIEIKPITDDKTRRITFNKRKTGLMKKAHELSVLCGCDVGFIVLNNNNNGVYQFANSDMDHILLRYASYNEPYESRNNNDFRKLMSRKSTEQSGGVAAGNDSDDEEDAFSNGDQDEAHSNTNNMNQPSNGSQWRERLLEQMGKPTDQNGMIIYHNLNNDNLSSTANPLFGNNSNYGAAAMSPLPPQLMGYAPASYQNSTSVAPNHMLSVGSPTDATSSRHNQYQNHHVQQQKYQQYSSGQRVSPRRMLASPSQLASPVNASSFVWPLPVASPTNAINTNGEQTTTKSPSYQNHPNNNEVININGNNSTLASPSKFETSNQQSNIFEASVLGGGEDVLSESFNNRLQESLLSPRAYTATRNAASSVKSSPEDSSTMPTLKKARI